MQKKTKIIATIGPRSSDEKTITSMINEGTNIFRFNMKHNNHNWHLEKYRLLKSIANKLNANIGSIADIQGPSLRTGIHKYKSSITIKKNDIVFMSSKEVNTKEKWIPFNHSKLIKDIQKNSIVYIQDGLIKLKVIGKSSDYIKTVSLHNGILGNNKSVSIPQLDLDLPTLTAKDKKDIQFAIENGFDYIALSFARDSNDIDVLKKIIKSNRGIQKVIVKIENINAIRNLEDIIKNSDAVMIARGDLGIEIPFEKVPKLQKQIINKCRELAKPVIVATQLLDSMQHNLIPTRAEVADVANAILDKCDALMLSAESAIGQYPVKSVNTLSKISRYNESQPYKEDILYNPNSFEEIIIAASVKFSIKKTLNPFAGYLVFTESGKSARFLSRYRLNLPIYTFSQNYDTYKCLTLSWGVESHLLKLSNNPVINIKNAINQLKNRKIVNNKDKLITIFGNNVGVQEANNSLSVINVS